MTDISPSQIDSEELVPGNTKIRARGWVFTLNNPEPGDPSHITQFFERYEAMYVFQEEQASTPHLQGFVHFKNQIQFSTLKKIMRRAHLEVAHDWKRSKEYCSKLDTRAGHVYTNIEEIKKSLIVPPVIKLHYWQQCLADTLRVPADDRAIVWVYGEKGAEGKTTFAKWYIMTEKNKKCIYLNSGKTADLMYACSNIQPDVVFIDVARTQMDRFNYQAIEQIKNGIFFSGKYESKMVILNSPHVVIFANAPPNTEALSKDRWNIIQV